MAYASKITFYTCKYIERVIYDYEYVVIIRRRGPIIIIIIIFIRNPAAKDIAESKNRLPARLPRGESVGSGFRGL